mmetsp:Transcript_13252/g.31401  ORF Transcript_13252/g.31401 Transcript_13252/m.31401 type:complete len:205 (-) Transcript_13252:683-1297(-)
MWYSWRSASCRRASCPVRRPPTRGLGRCGPWCAAPRWTPPPRRSRRPLGRPGNAGAGDPRGIGPRCSGGSCPWAQSAWRSAKSSRRPSAGSTGSSGTHQRTPHSAAARSCRHTASRSCVVLRFGRTPSAGRWESLPLSPATECARQDSSKRAGPGPNQRLLSVSPPSRCEPPRYPGVSAAPQTVSPPPAPRSRPSSSTRGQWPR